MSRNQPLQGPVRFGLILAGTVPAAACLYKIQLCSWPDQFLGSIPCYPNVPLALSFLFLLIGTGDPQRAQAMADGSWGSQVCGFDLYSNGGGMRTSLNLQHWTGIQTKINKLPPFQTLSSASFPLFSHSYNFPLEFLQSKQRKA